MKNKITVLLLIVALIFSSIPIMTQPGFADASWETYYDSTIMGSPNTSPALNFDSSKYDYYFYWYTYLGGAMAQSVVASILLPNGQTISSKNEGTVYYVSADSSGNYRPTTPTPSACSQYFDDISGTVKGYWNGPDYNNRLYIARKLKNAVPIITSTTSSGNVYSDKSGHDIITLTGAVQDTNIGQTLTQYYRIDGSTGQTGTVLGIITADGTAQAYSYDVNIGSSSQGTHTIYTWTDDGNGGKSPEISTAFTIDKAAPVITINPYSTTPTSNSVTVTASVNKGTLNVVSKTFSVNGSFTFVATDDVGNISSKNVTISHIDKSAVNLSDGQVWTAPVSGIYNFELAGMQGSGDTPGYGIWYPGGGGGIIKVSKYLNAGEQVFAEIGVSNYGRWGGYSHTGGDAVPGGDSTTLYSGTTNSGTILAIAGGGAATNNNIYNTTHGGPGGYLDNDVAADRKMPTRKGGGCSYYNFGGGGGGYHGGYTTSTGTYTGVAYGGTSYYNPLMTLVENSPGGNYVTTYGTPAAGYIKVYPKNDKPTMTVSTIKDLNFSDETSFNTLTIEGSVKDTDSGQNLVVFARINGTPGTSGTTLGSVTADTTNQSFSGTLDVSSAPQGANTVYVWVSDPHGSTSTEMQITFNMNKIDPVITIAPYDTDPTNQNVVVNASTNKGTLNAASHTFANNGSFTFEAIDGFGNYASKTVTVTNIDKAPPNNPSIYLNTEDAVNQNVTVVIMYSVDSKVKEYRIDGGAWTAYTDSFEVTQNCTIEARSADAVGNMNSGTTKAINNIDKTPPTDPVITLSTEEPTNVDVNVSITYSGDSEVKEYRIDSSSWQEYTAPFAVSGNCTIDARSADSAGNMNAGVTKAITNINKTLPVITIEAYDTMPTNKNIIVKASTNKGTLNATSHTFTTNGSFTFVATDVYGNKVSETVNISNIDKMPPVKPVITVNRNIMTISTSQGDTIKYKLNAGIQKNYSGAVALIDGIYDIDAVAFDSAGNTSDTGVLNNVVVYETQRVQAESSVSKAENSKSSGDINAARNLVNNLPTGADKNALSARLDAIVVPRDRDGGSSASTSVVSTPVPVPTPPTMEIVDINGHWAEKTISNLFSEGIVSGIPTDEPSKVLYQPNTSIVRAEFAQIFANITGTKVEPSTPFSDVSKKAWYAGAVSELSGSGVINGYPDNSFKPFSNITREEAVSMVYKLLIQKGAVLDTNSDALSKYKDKPSEWSKEAISACINAGIIEGDGDGHLKPKSTLTRAEAATIVNNILNNPELSKYLIRKESL